MNSSIDIQDGMNCEQFYDLKERWQNGKLDKISITDCIRRTFPLTASKILAWLNRPQPVGERDILTLAKFDA